MLEINFNNGRATDIIFKSDTSLCISEIWYKLEKKGLSQNNFYITQNGRLVDENACVDGDASLIPRLRGGKGGFGSMLRAIGAQIEKTTNREACRDLSGRRLRDINEEKRLKAWIEKQADREEDAAERKKKKLERLCAEPKHEFKDKNYERERSVLAERIDDAVAEGFKVAAASTSNTQMDMKKKVQGVKRKTILDDDLDSDDLDSSDDDSDVDSESPKKKLATEEQTSSAVDSEQSNDSTPKSEIHEKSPTINSTTQIPTAVTAM